MITPERLKEIEQLAEAATDGPWVTGEASWNEDGDVRYVLHGVKSANFVDAQFIAASRTLVPELIAEVKRLREVIEQYEKDLPTFKDIYGMAPDATGGLPAEEFVRRARDALGGEG